MLNGSSAKPVISGGSAASWYRVMTSIGTTISTSGRRAVSARLTIDSQRQNRAVASGRPGTAGSAAAARAAAQRRNGSRTSTPLRRQAARGSYRSRTPPSWTRSRRRSTAGRRPSGSRRSGAGAVCCSRSRPGIVWASPESTAAQPESSSAAAGTPPRLRRSSTTVAAESSSAAVASATGTHPARVNQRGSPTSVTVALSPRSCPAVAGQLSRIRTGQLGVAEDQRPCRPGRAGAESSGQGAQRVLQGRKEPS